jgi:Tfp pilus tip-associated adhesin PilY1
MLVHKLDRLAVVPPYRHTYYVDGRLTSASAKINGSWTTVLTGGLGAGEKGLFALDVTATDPSSHTVLFEKTSAEFGYIYGQPSLLRMPGGTWSIFTGNGLGTNDRAQLLVVNLDDESVTAINTLDDTPAGLSEATLIDTNNDQIVDLAFAGDTKGDMWRFAFDTDPVTVTKVFDGSADQPITIGAEVGEHPNGGYMVYWGTGNATSITDARDTSYPTQAIYGIWDQATGTRIATQTLATAIGETFPNAITGDRTETVRYIDENEFETIQSSNKHFQYICSAADNDCIEIKGWKFELPANERLTGGPPQLRAARLSFVSNNPLGTNTFDDGALNPDMEGDNWLMSLDYLTGGDSVGTPRASFNKGVALNLNGDTLLDAQDMIDGVTPPVGLQLGEGSVSQPIIALLGPSIDMMFINGLKLPLPQVEPGGPLFNGHIDVVVDSPFDGGGSKAPNEIAYMSQGYNIQTNDGLGKAVDGLVHEYSDIHGVSYVDLFELEPRRGLTSMDGTPFPPVNGDHRTRRRPQRQRDLSSRRRQPLWPLL